MARYWAAKTDENHQAIREDFRKAGWKWLDLHRLKGACDGLVFSPDGYLYLLEVKRLEGKRQPKASMNAKPATKQAQKEFSDVWPVYVVTSVEDAQEFRLTRGLRFVRHAL